MVPPIDVSQYRYAIVPTAKFSKKIKSPDEIETHPYAVVEYIKKKTFNEYPFKTLPKPHLLQTFHDLRQAQKFVSNYQHQTNRHALQNLIQYVFYNPVFYFEFGFSVYHKAVPITDTTLALELKYKTEYTESHWKMSYADIKNLIVRFLYDLYTHYNTMYNFTYVDSMEDLYKFLFI